MKPRDLSRRQKVFLDEYLKGRSPTQADRLAGYSAQTAVHCPGRILKQSSMKLALEKAATKNSRDMSFMEPEAILNRIEEIRAQAQDQGDLALALRACDIQARAAGLFIEKKEVNHSGLAELLALASRKAKQQEEKVVN